MFTIKLLNLSLNSSRLTSRNISNGSKTLLGLFKKESNPENAGETAFDIIDNQEEINPQRRAYEIYNMRNKSRLNEAHRKIVNERLPYKSPQSWVHETLKYKRKMYAKYGSRSGIDPRICFFTEEELKVKNEYERVAFPKTVPEMIAINEQEKREKREKILEREAIIIKNLAKLDTWTKDIKDRREKKETDARIAKERKDRLIEEVRRHFGYTVDPRDERFKLLLEQREKQQKKVIKEQRRKEKEAKFLAKLKEDKKPENKSEESEPEKKTDQEN